MEVQTEFLKLHPATELWWEQRELCRTCEFHETHMNSFNRPSGERCKRIPIIGSITGTTFMYCIDARLPQNACGPAARLYRRKK